MLAHDHRLNPRFQPTSFDGTKPSFMEWSEEVIAFLAVTDYQKFIPLLTAAASSKDVIQADVMFTGALSDTIEKIKKMTIRSKRKQIEQKFKPKTRFKKFRISTKRFKTLSLSSPLSKENWSRKNHQLCSRRISFSGTLCFMRPQGIQTSWSDEDSGAVTGLEIWGQVTILFAGSAKTRTVSLLKQIMAPAE